MRIQILQFDVWKLKTITFHHTKTALALMPTCQPAKSKPLKRVIKSTPMHKRTLVLFQINFEMFKDGMASCKDSFRLVNLWKLSYMLLHFSDLLDIASKKMFCAFKNNYV
jgi:hypothetical protein